MNHDRMLSLLQEVQNGQVSAENALKSLKNLPFEDLDYAKVDHHRELRSGFPEVIFCPGKTLTQISGIAEKLMQQSEGSIMASRATSEIYEAILKIAPDALWHEAAKIVQIPRKITVPLPKTVLVVTAGTSDIPVAEEAAVTAEIMGNPVNRLFDVGVAGLHRLLAHKGVLDEAGIIIVVAGMEGALASVVGGLTNQPVIAVPTSVGYGSSFGGVTALLAMLNSCANGIGVMNIDNGYGAACLATRINRLGRQEEL